MSKWLLCPNNASRAPLLACKSPEDLLTNEAPYGDQIQTPYEANAELGTYSWKVVGLTITNSGHDCCKEWKAKLVAVDDLGTGPPDPWIGSCICRASGFRPHTTTVLAEYTLRGSTCCVVDGAR